MWNFENNQDVGSEAATIKRVRNSSLVERLCAEDVSQLGRGAFLHGRSLTGRTGGQAGRENAGMSSEKKGENPFHRKPKGSWATIVVPG